MIPVISTVLALLAPLAAATFCQGETNVPGQ
jgi:hypothetical protein